MKVYYLAYSQRRFDGVETRGDRRRRSHSEVFPYCKFRAHEGLFLIGAQGRSHYGTQVPDVSTESKLEVTSSAGHTIAITMVEGG